MIYIGTDKTTGLDVINLTRGDDGVLTVDLKAPDGSDFVLSGEEYLILGVRQKPDHESELLIEVQSEPGSNEIQFRHQDTMDILPGEYSADIQLMTRDAQRVTVWPMLTGGLRTRGNFKNFCLMSEVVDA